MSRFTGKTKAVEEGLECSRCRESEATVECSNLELCQDCYEYICDNAYDAMKDKEFDNG